VRQAGGVDGQRPGQHHRLCRLDCLPGALHLQVPRAAQQVLGLQGEGARHQGGGRADGRRRPRRPSDDPGVGHLRPAIRHAVGRERDLRDALAPLAADDRPAVAGQPLGQEHGEGAQAAHHQADAGRLPPRVRAVDPRRHPRAPRERPGEARPVARPDPPEADVQAERPRAHPARRHRRRLLRGLQVLHHLDAAQPALRARDLHQGDHRQLHRDLRGPRGPGTSRDIHAHKPRRGLLLTIYTHTTHTRNAARARAPHGSS
jgi:hypothetical protein